LLDKRKLFGIILPNQSNTLLIFIRAGMRPYRFKKWWRGETHFFSIN